MNRIKKYQDEDDEFLHPFWLGLLMLFTVVIVIGMICFLQKKCSSHIRYLFNCLRCKNELNNEHNSKINKRLSTTTTYNWAPVYVPHPSLSPKFYKLVQNIQMTSLDTNSSTQRTRSNEDSIDNDTCSITNEFDQVKRSPPQLNKNRNCETARRFYASMRHTTQCEDTSIESSSTDPSLLPTNRLIKSNGNKKLNLFRTPRFFQSITNTRD